VDDAGRMHCLAPKQTVLKLHRYERNITIYVMGCGATMRAGAHRSVPMMGKEATSRDAINFDFT
jgi:hypothetical protein